MSLGLVAYDDSEGSENESDSEENPPLTRNPTQNKVASTLPKANEQSNKEPAPVNGSGHISDDELELPTNIANRSAHIIEDELEPVKSSDKAVNLHLPESKLSLINTDIDIKCLTSTTKKSGPVKITIPSLNEVIDESEPPSKKKLKPSQKGSGLFALLPNPKSSMVPQSVVNKKPLTPSARKPTPVPISAKRPPPTKAPRTSSLISYEDSGDEDETLETVDFFSLESKEKDVTPAAIDVDVDIPDVSSSIRNEIIGASSTAGLASSSNWQGATQSTGSLEIISSHQASSSYSAPAADTQHNFGYSTSEFMSVSNSDLELDQQAMQQLCGRRDRIKMQEVNLIEVSGDAIMPDSREWLTKQLTEEVVHRPSHKRKDGPTNQQKRKHQITYLAYQAKENELELKNQWANNRMSRKQTQAKYGF